jgi:hypothetical protein
MMYYGAAELTIYTVAIALSKISFGLTLLRLTDGWIRVFVYFAISTLAIFAIPPTVIPWVQCKPLAKTFVDFIPGTCINKHPSVVFGRFQACEQTTPKSVYFNSLADMRCSMVSTDGCVSCTTTLENSLGIANAHARKGRCMYRHESRNIVSICTIRLRAMLTSSKSRSHVNYPIDIHPEVDSTGCIM